MNGPDYSRSIVYKAHANRKKGKKYMSLGLAQPQSIDKIKQAEISICHLRP